MDLNDDKALRSRLSRVITKNGLSRLRLLSASCEISRFVSPKNCSLLLFFFVGWSFGLKCARAAFLNYRFSGWFWGGAESDVIVTLNRYFWLSYRVRQEAVLSKNGLNGFIQLDIHSFRSDTTLFVLSKSSHLLEISFNSFIKMIAQWKIIQSFTVIIYLHALELFDCLINLKLY